MHNKLIAAGIGLFGYGAFLSWSVTADHFEGKMKRNQRLLGDVIDRQAQTLIQQRDLLLNGPETVSLAEAQADPELGVGTTPEGRTAYSDADAAVETERDIIPPGETPAETEARLRETIRTYVGEDENAAHDFSSRVVATREADLAAPYIISAGDYAGGDDEGAIYDKLQLTYYPRERIFVDEDDDLVDHKDIDVLIGWRALDSFGDQSGDPDVVFVRNRKLSTDYEVVRETEEQPPLHVRHGYSDSDTFEAERAAGTLTRFSRGDV